jgi:hypothetical protein
MSDHCYADHGSFEFNARLHDCIMRIGEAVQKALGKDLSSLVLGGGYGRGEGGVYEREGHESPYNDLDFTLIIKSQTNNWGTELQRISHQFSHELGIEVDFSRPLLESQLGQLPHWLMWHDLVHGYKLIAGNDCLKNLAPKSFFTEPVPVIEATRLLLNRGAGLLWSRRILEGFDPLPDNSFLARNVQKAALAEGDALCILAKTYQVPYRGRVERVANLSSVYPGIVKRNLVMKYDEALRFRFSPHLGETMQITLKSIQDEIDQWLKVFLFLESTRCHQEFSSALHYESYSAIREPEQHCGAKLIRNLVRNFQHGKLSVTYPREMLFRKLPVLLSQKTSQYWKRDSASILHVWRKFN